MNKSKKYIYYLFIFCIASFFGYIIEELYMIIFKYKFVNRGFLYGSYLPIYGFGALTIILFLKKYKNNKYIIIPISMILTEILEFFTGYFLYLIYHRRWWNYKGAFLNINGFICLRSAIMFSILSLVLIYFIEPLLYKIFNNHYKPLKFFTLCFSLIILVDFILTLLYRYRGIMWIK